LGWKARVYDGNLLLSSILGPKSILQRRRRRRRKIEK
jgi:hypothetical protein